MQAWTRSSSLNSSREKARCRVTDARSITTTYTYDAENRLTGKAYSSGDPAVSYFYDQASYNGLTITNGHGRRTGMSDTSGQTAWSYDTNGRVATEQRTIAGVTKTFSYTYNLNGSLSQLTYPSGLRITPGYNVAGQNTVIYYCNGCGPGMDRFVEDASYAPHGGLESVVLGHVWGGSFAGLNNTYTYNKRLQPVNMKATHTSGTVTVLDYTYSFVSGTINDGTVKSITNNLSTGRSQTYTYDEMNRLATAQSQAVSGNDCWGQSFGYDRYANLLSIAVTKCSAPALSLSVNGNNRVTNTGFTYDAAGDLLTDGSNTYTWNGEGRMATAAGVTYTYDGDGRRVKKSNGKLYWYGPSGEVLAESDLSGNILWEYIYFNGQRVARRDPVSGNAYYYLADRLGSARVVAKVSSAGVYQGVVEESDFYPYGTERPISNDPNTPDNTYKFTGHERDTETGLDHTLHRQYASNLGRWHSPDPKHGKLSDPQSWNRYAYVGSSPCNFVDSNGGERTAPPPDFGSFGNSGRNDGPLFIPPDDMTFEERMAALGILTPLARRDRIEDNAYDLLHAFRGSMTDDCAQALGASDAGAVAKMIDQISIMVGYLGPVVIGDAAKYGQYNGDTQTITLNDSIDWLNPNGTIASNEDGFAIAAVAGTLANYLDISGGTMTTTQFMGVLLLHELGHAFPGDRHPGDTPEAYKAYDQGVWNACKDVIGP